LRPTAGVDGGGKCSTSFEISLRGGGRARGLQRVRLHTAVAIMKGSYKVSNPASQSPEKKPVRRPPPVIIGRGCVGRRRQRSSNRPARAVPFVVRAAVLDRSLRACSNMYAWTRNAPRGRITQTFGERRRAATIEGLANWNQPLPSCGIFGYAMTRTQLVVCTLPVRLRCH
jgi:hypothetical protein